MTQETWPLPLDTADFADIKDAVEDMGANLSTNHAGPSEPTGANLLNYMWYVDTTNTLIKIENGAGALVAVLKLEANGGMLRIDGSNSLTADLNFGGFHIKNVGETACTGAIGTNPTYKIPVKNAGGSIVGYTPVYADWDA